MSKYLLSAAAAALLMVGMNSPAFAAWELVFVSEEETSIFRAETAGKSGNVKACYESQVIITTYQWTHSQTGKTRGIVEDTDVVEEVPVDKSNCQ